MEIREMDTEKWKWKWKWKFTLTCFLSWFMGRRVVTMIKIVIVEVFVVVVAAVFIEFAIIDRTVDEWSRRSRMWMILLY